MNAPIHAGSNLIEAVKRYACIFPFEINVASDRKHFRNLIIKTGIKKENAQKVIFKKADIADCQEERPVFKWREKTSGIKKTDFIVNIYVALIGIYYGVFCNKAHIKIKIPDIMNIKVQMKTAQKIVFNKNVGIFVMMIFCP